MPYLDSFFPSSTTDAVSALTAGEAAHIAAELTAGLDHIFGPASALHDAALNPAQLTADLAAALSIPCASGSAAAQAAALAAFQRPLVARHALASTTWTLVLERAAGHSALAAHPFAQVAPQLVATLPLLPYLGALSRYFESTAAAARPEWLEPALVFHAVIAAEPGSVLALELSAALKPLPADSAFSAETTEAALVRHMRENLEQTEVDRVSAAFAWLRRIRASADILRENSPLAAAAIGAGVAPDGVSASTLFRLRLVSQHRSNASSAAKDLQAEALILARKLPEEFVAARAALRALPALARDLAAWPASLLDGHSTPVVAFAARVIVEENQRHRPAAARAAAGRRLVHDFVRETGAPLDRLAATLDQLSSSPGWSAAEPASALAALRETLPALEAAQILLANHAAIGADVARRAYASQPEYAAKTGPAGEKNCAKDNALTLRQLALYLIDGQPQPAERLQAWWNAVVGVHIVNRPAHLFTHNLRSLHAALRAVLPPSGLDLVFAHLHQLYKESIGVPDLPLLHFGSYPAAPSAESTQLLPASVVRKPHLKRVGSLAGAPSGFVKDWACWLDAPTDAALGDLAVRHGHEPVLRALALLIGDVLRAENPGHAAAKRVAALPARLAARLLAAHIERPAPEEDRCLRDLSLTHGYFAEQLRAAPLDHAVLQTTRFVLELVGPHLTETPADWERNITAAHAALAQGCPAPARPLLDRWVDHLRALGPGLYPLKSFLSLAYPAGVPVLGTTIGEEKKLRGALTAYLLSIALPSEKTPWPGKSLRSLAPVPAAEENQRLLVFIDKLFDQLDGASYYDLTALLSNQPAASTPVNGASFTAAASSALAEPPPKSSLLGGLFGPPPEHLAHDLALAASLSPAWLAPVLTGLAADKHRAYATERSQTLSGLLEASPAR